MQSQLAHTTSSTKERLLDAAERLFADHGIDGTSLRLLTQEAGANLAAVHYHFGSKEALIDRVFSRRLSPLNRERLSLLDAVEEGARRRRPRLEEVLQAFLLPALRLSRDLSGGGRHFIRLMGRMLAEPGPHLEQLIETQFREVIERFLAALGRALPRLSRAELFWRFHFVAGAMVHTIADPGKLERLSGGLCRTSDAEETCRILVRFAAAGFAAPPVLRRRGKP
jgi:AcrR family transcriptional regulator